MEETDTFISDINIISFLALERGRWEDISKGWAVVGPKYSGYEGTY